MNQKRDTAKDIILGSKPSGITPRQARDGLEINMNSADINKIELNNLRNQIKELHKQQIKFLEINENTKKQFEANQKKIQLQLSSSEKSMIWQKDLNYFQKQLKNLKNQFINFEQNFSAIQTLNNRQNNEILLLKNKLKNYHDIDNKANISMQTFDQRLRELQSHLLHLKRLVDSEISDRIKSNRIQSDLLSRLQKQVYQQEASKNEILKTISRRNGIEKDQIIANSKYLNEKIQSLTLEMSKNANENEQKLREEFNQKYLDLQNTLKVQLDTRITHEIEISQKNKECWQNQSRLIENLKSIVYDDKLKYWDQFQKINNAIAVIENHIELRNTKFDKIISAEIQSRKLHETGLLTKVDEIETKLNNYLQRLTQSVENVKIGVNNIKFPILDTDAVRRDMNLIATDKNKISMKGLLKLEERISQLQQGLVRDRRELQHKVENSIEKNLNNKLKLQIQKLDDLMDEVESAQNKIRDKLERQMPKDLSELCAKVDNFKAQITSRIDQEEEERYLAIKELQEVYGRIASSMNSEKEPSGIGIIPTTISSLKRDIDECKVAIKKLAESVTTVKNVLDSKVHSEIRRREQDIEVLSSRLDALTIHRLQ